MKMNTSFHLVLAALTGFGINAVAQQIPGRLNVVEFEIEIAVDRAKNGVHMKCIEGCMWKTLSFSCGPDIECVSSIDESGTPAE